MPLPSLSADNESRLSLTLILLLRWLQPPTEAEEEDTDAVLLLLISLSRLSLRVLLLLLLQLALLPAPATLTPCARCPLGSHSSHSRPLMLITSSSPTPKLTPLGPPTPLAPSGRAREGWEKLCCL